nr:MAG: hypothetical protein [Molluscum contagiosum virus]
MSPAMRVFCSAFTNWMMSRCVRRRVISLRVQHLTTWYPSVALSRLWSASNSMRSPSLKNWSKRMGRKEILASVTILPKLST